MSQAILSPPGQAPVHSTDEEPFFEVVDGQYVELPPMGVQESHLANILAFELGRHSKAQNAGRVETEVLFKLFTDQNQKRRPDVVFLSYDRWPKQRRVPDEAAWEVVPDLAVEVVSPNDSANYLMDKIQDYFQAGTRRVWVVWPKHQLVHDYQSPTVITVPQVGDALDGGSILPGFRLALADLFEVHLTDDDKGPEPESE